MKCDHHRPLLQLNITRLLLLLFVLTKNQNSLKQILDVTKPPNCNKLTNSTAKKTIILKYPNVYLTIQLQNPQ